MKNKGFTLIELVFVVLILSTLVGLASPLFRNSYRRASWEGAASRMADLMSYARERAVMERMRTRVDFDTEGGLYWLSADGPEGFHRTGDRWGRTRRVPPDVALRTDAPSVTFFPDGTASEAEVRLETAEKDLCLLHVDPVLGWVTVDEKTGE
jgi:prepilin-type N-terminal cleavage/methylation domain-containing protein